MKHIQKKQQRGIAALAALLVIIIFAIMGITVANKAKENEKLVGADVRYGAVFEAGEQTLRRVVRYLNEIKGSIKEGDGSVGLSTDKQWVKNFEITEQMRKHDFQDDGVFVWSTEEFKTVCPDCDFAAEVDAGFWREKAVPSDFFNKDNVSEKNYLKNIRTYTFVEEILEPENSISAGATSKTGGFPGPTSTGGSTEKKFYLITIKSSGFPPGKSDDKKTADEARENVIIQSIFVKY